jgi:hypothetical protein
MTLFQVEELTSYWAQHPPLHLLFAAYLGLRSDRHPKIPPEQLDIGGRSGPDPGSILAQLGPGFTGGDIHAGLSPVILDFAELRRAAAISE